LQSPGGLLLIEELTQISEDELTEDAARAAGFESLSSLLASLRSGEGSTLYRIRFRRIGDDPRKALRSDSELDEEALTSIEAQLDRWDAASPTGPWTTALLNLIVSRPAESSRLLAEDVQTDQPTFKRRVRQLKGLGLTESLEVGYRLSPRGQSYLERTNRDR
jgi:hypothetical protein